MKIVSYTSLAIALLLANSQEVNCMRLSGSGDDKLKSALKAIIDSDSSSSCGAKPSGQTSAAGGSASSAVNVPIIIPQGWN